MVLDRFDRHILEVLQLDGRINNQDLAERIGLSPSPCLRRVRALEESGLIVGYRALLDAKKIGFRRNCAIPCGLQGPKLVLTCYPQAIAAGTSRGTLLQSTTPQTQHAFGACLFFNTSTLLWAPGN